MEKPIVNMRNWELYVYDEKYNLSGIVDVHPKLGKNAYVGCTSDMVQFRLEADVLRYETRNTVYICPLKYMTQHPYSNVVEEYKKELTHRDERSQNECFYDIAFNKEVVLQGETKVFTKEID